MEAWMYSLPFGLGYTISGLQEGTAAIQTTNWDKVITDVSSGATQGAIKGAESGFNLNLGNTGMLIAGLAIAYLVIKKL